MKQSIKTYSAAAFTGLALGLAVTATLAPTGLSATTMPFGGQIEDTQVCDCTANFWIKVGLPKPAFLIYEPGITKLYKSGQIFRTGPNVLGNYIPGGTCKYDAPECDDKPVTGIISIIGNSD